MASYRFTEQSFDAIALYCQLRDTFADHKTNTQFSYFVWYPCKDKQPGRHATSLLPYPLKLTAFAQAQRTVKCHNSLLLNGKLPTPFGAASFQNTTAIAGRHAFHKTMFA
jgi:hypothetical protein